MNASDNRPPIDTGLFRRVMGAFATGVTVITAEADGGVRGMTANAFMSGSMSPPLCIISVSKKARMHELLETAGHFGVSMLAKGQEDVSQHFARQGATEPDLSFEHMNGIPVLAGVCASVAAETVARHDCGDHTLFIGHIVGLRDYERPPLAYHGGKYAELLYKSAMPADPMVDFWELEHN
ncbi:MAG: flavin reductase family protein [Pseudolabrys sp.]|nr:flavin reductase family protein [Pseudolabrys sp.]